MKKISLFIILSLLVVPASYLKAQNDISPGAIKALYNFKFAQNMEWPNEDTIKVFSFGVLSSDPEILEGFKVLNGKSLKSKSVSVKIFKKPSAVTGVHLLYVGNEYNSQIKSIFSGIMGNNKTLFISDNLDDKKSVMLNLVSEGTKVRFELNKANVINQGLKVGPKLLLLGGTELDVAQLYKDTQENLDQEKEKVKSQQKELVLQRNEIEKQKSDIEKQQKEIEFQKSEIDKQRVLIEDQKKSIREQLAKLAGLGQEVEEKQKALAEKIKMLSEQESRIKNQESEIKKQQADLDNGRLTLDNQLKEIDKQESRIREQKFVLAKQGTQIKVQQNIIYVFVLFLLLIVGLAYFIYRSYQMQKRFNKQLAEKNDQIKKTSDQLETEKEITINSINYAKTIQTAMLPMANTLANYYENFLLYRPRDIVSGDFYWFNPIKVNGVEKLLVAAVDCTGHGVPGAFMSMIGNNILNDTVKAKQIYDPAEILTNLKKEVEAALKQDETKNSDGMDVALCLMEPFENNKVKITFSAAKRPLYYIKKEEGMDIKHLKGDRISIGGILRRKTGLEFKNQELILSKGDMIYLLTDGLFDQNNIAREKFTENRFVEAISKHVEDSMAMQYNELSQRLDEFQETAKQRDDITAIGIKI